MKQHPFSIPTLFFMCSLAATCCLPLPFAVGQATLPAPIRATPLPTPPASPQLPSVPTVSSPVPVAANPTMLQILGNARRGFCAHIRQSPIGKLTSGIRKPLSMASGGLVPAEKKPHPDEKEQPGPEGTAAQVKTVQLQAPKRQNAVKQLQRIDVRYHPEVEATLIAALRADPSECVRFEAAVTLATLPVCSPTITKALTVCVEGSDTDGNPVELSQRVRLQAGIALAHCTNCSPIDLHEELERPEYPAITAIDQSAVIQAAAFLPISAALAGDTNPAGLSSVAPSEIELSTLVQPNDAAELAPAVTLPSVTAPANATRPSPSKPNRRPRNVLEILQAAEQ